MVIQFYTIAHNEELQQDLKQPVKNYFKALKDMEVDGKSTLQGQAVHINAVEYQVVKLPSTSRKVGLEYAYLDCIVWCK